MALIGSIENYGQIQGELNNYGQSLTGYITNADALGGEVVGMRGLKGDKGDTGDTGDTGATGNGISSITKTATAGLVDTYTIGYTDGNSTTYDVTNGADGQDGADGFSPSASVSKAGSVATITITDKDGTTTADIYDGSGGGASAFIAEYGVTTYADVKDAYDEDAIILCTVDDSGNMAICQLAYYDDANDTFYFAQPQSDGFYLASIAIGDTWDDGYFRFASTDTATQLRDGLMTALDKQKLDGIASGAEVNVQSDWNEADSTADDYIKNKPTIPSKTSDLNNDSGFVTSSGLLDLFYPVGSYYETSDKDFNPNVTWGGTWVLETEGQVHISGSASGTYQITGAPTDTNDGGAPTVTLDTNNMPAHTHGSKTLTGTVNIRGDETAMGVSGIVTRKTVTWSGSHGKIATTTVTNPTYDTVTVTATHEHTSVGSGTAHENMQPYIIVNRWHRTA